jgi:hypothetical protein
MIEVVPIWADGPDIIVSGDKKIIVLMTEADRTKSRHGFCDQWHLDLSKSEAIDLVEQLQKAIKVIESLES